MRSSVLKNTFKNSVVLVFGPGALLFFIERTVECISDIENWFINVLIYII